jgi:hypothetical protein
MRGRSRGGGSGSKALEQLFGNQKIVGFASRVEATIG